MSAKAKSSRASSIIVINIAIMKVRSEEYFQKVGNLEVQSPVNSVFAIIPLF